MKTPRRHGAMYVVNVCRILVWAGRKIELCRRRHWKIPDRVKRAWDKVNEQLEELTDDEYGQLIH